MTKPQNTQDANAVNLFIIDESGSMGGMAENIRETFTGLLEKIKKEQQDLPELQQFVNLWTFSNHQFNEGIRFQEVQRWDGNPPDYSPMGGTPLYDALGKAIRSLGNSLFVKNLPQNETRVSVFILTDGMENNSREWSLEAIRNCIKACEEKGWEFTYYGADHDILAAAEALNIKNPKAFSKTREGMQQMAQEHVNEEYNKKLAFIRSIQ